MRLSGLLLASSVLIGTDTSSGSRLDVIDLPVGFAPEGITNGAEWIAYVGSLQTGNIWMGDLETGEGKEIELDAPGPAVGLDHDRRSGYLYVAGGPLGSARVYDADFGLVVDLALAADPNSTFVNDVFVDRTAAYFTDSFQSVVYKVNLDRETGALVDGSAFETLRLSDNVPFVAGAFNANGIVATDDGSMLIVVFSQAQQLFAIDPNTGVGSEIDLGGGLLPGPAGDGLVLRKNTLWVVDNTAEQIYEVSLSADLSCGFVLPRSVTSPLFNSQTTAMRKGNSLYAVNAKFGTAAEAVATTPYEIVRVDRDDGVLACEA